MHYRRCAIIKTYGERGVGCVMRGSSNSSSSRTSMREGAVSKRVILNCLITWSTRCAHRPLGRRPAICPHGTGGAAPPPLPRRACQHWPRMQISRRAGAGLRSVVRWRLRVRTTARRVGACVTVPVGPVGTSRP